MLLMLMRYAACALYLALSTVALAQWSSDPALNLAIANRTNQQVQPKVRPTPDGGCWISWFDNAAGGYDVYIQRLDAQGNEMLPHNGRLVSDRSVSSTQDYGLVVTTDGHAVLAFNDTRNGFPQIVLQRVAPDGALLLGPAGKNQTNATSTMFFGPPRLSATDSNGVVVSWFESVTNPSGFRVQRLDLAGNNLWTPPSISGVLELPPAGTWSPSDIQATPGGGALVLWVRNPTGGVNDVKHLYLQKYLPNGNRPWASPLIIFDAGSIQTGYFPTFESDGAGGGVFAWYTNSTPRNAYYQRVYADGSLEFDAPDPIVLLGTGRILISAALAYDPVNHQAFVFATESNTGQTQFGIRAQRYENGFQQWGDDGIELLPLSPLQNANLQAEVLGDGAALFYSDRAGNALLKGFGLDVEGDSVWGVGPITVCSVLSGKSRLDTTRNAAGMFQLAWSDTRTDTGDVYAQNVNTDATLGNAGPPPCDPDLNTDGNVDQDDVACLIDVVAGNPGCTAADPDFNRDGNVDQDDVAALINVVAGGACP